jgi:hypothetical protein
VGFHDLNEANMKMTRNWRRFRDAYCLRWRRLHGETTQNTNIFKEI